MSDKRDALEWELADCEYEGRLGYMSTRDQKELLITGMSGYKEMSDEELIECVKEGFDECDELHRLCDEFEASIAITKMLTIKGK